MQPSSIGTVYTWLRSIGRRLEPDTIGAVIPEDAQLLPNFCTGWIVFNVVVIAEMLAIVITLVVPRYILSPYPLQNLLLISIFVQWIALSGTTALCLTRRYLNRLPGLQGLAAAYALLLATTWLITEATLWLLWLSGQTPVPRPAWAAHLLIATIIIAAFVYALLLRYFVAKHELTRRTLSEERTRIQAMLSRIRPHFVYSSMNIIASLIRSDPAKAESAIEDMADLFRMMLSQKEMLVPIRNEVELARKYLALEALRLDNRLVITWDIGKFPRKAIMPVLILQPLLENAIRHGVEPAPGGGVVTVRLWEHENKIYIKIVNPIQRLKPLRAEERHSMTLEDLRLRLHNHYGEAARLAFGREGEEFVVSLVLPIRGDKS